MAPQTLLKMPMPYSRIVHHAELTTSSMAPCLNKKKVALEVEKPSFYTHKIKLTILLEMDCCIFHSIL